MSLKKLSKITNAELSAKGVSALADRPNSSSAQYGYSGLSAQKLKAWFDQLGIMLSNRLNQILDVLSTADACGHIAIPNELMPDKEGDLSLLDFLNEFYSGYMAYRIYLQKNQGSTSLQSLQSLLFQIDERMSANEENLQLELSLITDLIKKDTELGDAIESQIEQHNVSGEAHSDIRALVDLCSSAASDELNWAMQAHDSSEYAHEYIRGIIENVRMLAKDAYNLASGKSAVHPYSSVDAFITAVLNGASFNVGDVVIFKETNVPDLTVFMKEQESKPGGDIELDADTELLEKQSYYLNGYTFVALESGIDTSKLISTDEMQVIFNGFDSRIKAIQAYCEQLNSLIGENSAKIDTKEDAHKRVSTTASSITLETFTEYDLGVRTSLSLSLPAETTGFEAIVNFACRAQASSFDAPEEIYFQGDDTLEGHLYPVSNRVYEINIKEVLGTLVAKVGACDYEVIE